MLIAYVIYTCYGIFKVKSRRKNVPKEKKMSKKNYLFALLSHTKLDVNVNKDTLTELNYEVAQLQVSIEKTKQEIAKEFERIKG